MDFYKTLTFILIFVSFGWVTADNKESYDVHDYVRVIQHIQQTIHTDSRIIIAYNIKSDIDSILQQTTKPIFVINLNKTINADHMPEYYNMFVIIIKYIEDFNKFLNLFTLSDKWNKRGKFVVFYSGTEPFENIFKMSWNNYVVNINVFIWTSIAMNVYTYFPYKGNKCGENITAELLGTYPVDDLFPLKIPLTFHGCPIVTLIDHFPPFTLAGDLITDHPKKVGFETLLLKNVMQRMNLTPSIVLTPGTILGHKLPNNEFDGLLKYLKNERCQIMIGNLGPRPPFFFEHFEISFPYYSDDVYWYVPKASLGDKWQSLYLIFNIAMWLSILAIYVFNVLVWLTLTRYVKDIAEINSMSWCVLQMWRALLQGPFKLPKTSVMRILVITWSAMGFILASAYQSQLLSILTSPIYDHQISTLQELADSSLHIAYTRDDMDNYKDSSVDVERRIYAKAHFYPLTEYVKFVRSHSSQIAFQGSAVRVRYIHLLHYTYPDGTSKIYEIQASVLKTITCMYTVRGFPLLERINHIITLLLENGLFYKWIEDMDIGKVHDVKSENKNDTLSIQDLKGIFSLLTFGIVLSSLTFILEILISYKNKRSNG